MHQSLDYICLTGLLLIINHKSNDSYQTNKKTAQHTTIHNTAIFILTSKNSPLIISRL